ncbi:phosphoribosylanthranilate isomerase [candidate division KSB1 bacterium]|nr:phosphoribosylanthranilate isomerase [candidate division KSB1 bacterium]
MKATKIPRVKICCIQSIEEAWLAIRYGASALGLVSEMPSGPGPISEELIKQIAAVIPPGITSVLLTSKTDTQEIIGQQRRCGVNAIQIVDRLEKGRHQDFRDAIPGISIIQVIHVSGEASIEEAISIAPHVDAILLDSGNLALQVKELGGTGRTHDWNFSRKIRESVAVAIFLAGGLNPDNVTQAFQQVFPFGIDVCSGVRTNGKLDESKLAKFIERLH